MESSVGSATERSAAVGAIPGDRPRRLYLSAAFFSFAAAAALAVDLPIARLCLHGEVPGWLKDLLGLTEVFGHGAGVALIALAALVLGRLSPPNLARLAASAFGAGLTADLVKLVVSRARPRELPAPAGVWSTFLGWFPWAGAGGAGRSLNSAVQSFPSAHTATAVGLAVALTYFYPRGRWLFAFYALLVALQRITSGAHYVSDTCAAAALACLWGAWCVDSRGLGRLFDNWDRTRKAAAA